MHIHLIATGGAVMHNLALALHENGHSVSGSDDEIYNPARERLERAGLLPPAFGWFPERITEDLDCVILGMHARADNPELAKALELGIKVYSFPEFIYEHAKSKTRIVVAGSHGKTTTTAMIMHALRESDMDFDYLVGAQLEGFSTMVRLSDAPLMVIEGDEYLSSPLDRRPKFVHYRPQVAIITGVAWDHVNVFPTFEEYVRQFGLLLDCMEPDGSLIFFEEDPELRALVRASKAEVVAMPYRSFKHWVKGGSVTVKLPNGLPIELKIFGAHNLANLKAAALACECVGIKEEEFLLAAASFSGAARRLQKLKEEPKFAVWLDFAHAPSKAKATTEAVKSLYPQRELVACLELHTFSSLDKNFLPQYAHALDAADEAYVFFSPHTLEMKKMPPIEPAEIQRAFGHPNLRVFTESAALREMIGEKHWAGKNLLLMSSGSFGGLNLQAVVRDMLA